nr:MAG TPA: hypothetical protein [Caudoviricetes sp.]
MRSNCQKKGRGESTHFLLANISQEIIHCHLSPGSNLELRPHS